MSVSFLRKMVGVGSISALCCACGSDHRSAASANDAASAAPQPGEIGTVPPNGQPVDTPPANPPPQGLNPQTGNVIAGSAVAPAPAPQLTEPQIAMIAELANSGEIEQGKLAQTKAKSASVKKFAAMMVKHHGEAKAEQAKVFKQLSLMPAQSPDAAALQSDADKALGTLRAADGSEFDQAYINAQVDEHQKVLDTLDRKLLPAAKSEDLLTSLKKMRGTVDSHLTEAKSIQAELAKAGKL
jgi:putative membrane protein